MAELDDDDIIDPNTEECARNDFELIPDGTRVAAHIIENQIKITQYGGKMAVFTWEIIDEESPYIRRRLWDNLNYKIAPSKVGDKKAEQSVKIGRGQIVNVCKAVGYDQHTQNLDVLMFIPCLITIGIQKGKGEYLGKDNNRIKAVHPLLPEAPAGKAATTGVKPAAAPAARPAPTAAPGPRPAAVANTGGGRPWPFRVAPAATKTEIPY